jgi:protein-disulfide isomerase
MPTILTRLLSALTTKEGAVIAAPLVAGLAAIAALGSSPAPATQPLVLAQAAAPAPSTEASSFSAAQRAEIERIVKEYLISHPEVMIEVSKELEKRQSTLQAESARKVILERKASIFKAPTDFVFGNTKGEITVVEFFDYNCGWCKKAIDEVQKLAKADPQVRIVLKEMPIFGENSVTAARSGSGKM